MAIKSDKNIAHGNPYIGGTRIGVSEVVRSVEALGIEDYLEKHPNLAQNQVKEALNYCRNQRCGGNIVESCLYCSKGKDPHVLEQDTWKIANQLYKKYFTKN